MKNGSEQKMHMKIFDMFVLRENLDENMLKTENINIIVEQKNGLLQNSPPHFLQISRKFMECRDDYIKDITS